MVVENRSKKTRRLGLDKRIELEMDREEKAVVSGPKRMGIAKESEKIDRLVPNYSASNDLVSLDWKKMKIPPVLPSTEHTWLFKLMKPMKALLEAKENLHKDLGRDPTEDEIANATNMSAAQHNLRQMAQDFKTFVRQELKDLLRPLIALNRGGNSGFRHSLFWIRHAIIRSMTLSSFTCVSFGLESVRAEIQRAKLE